jgi:hypothetical protein
MLNTYYRDKPVTPSLDRAPACPLDPAPSLTAHYHPLAGGQLPPAPVGGLTGMDTPQHTRFRELGLSVAATGMHGVLEGVELFAVPAEGLSLRTDPSRVYGVHSLPVTWDRR